MTKNDNENYDWDYSPPIDVTESLSISVTTTSKSNRNCLYDISIPLEQQYEESVLNARNKSLDFFRDALFREALQG